MRSEITPIKNYMPEELGLEPLEYEEAKTTKRGVEDNSLERYYHNDVVEVYGVEESRDPSNIRIPDLVIEKQLKDGKKERELGYGILCDELGTGVDILYARENEDGDAVYGMPFLQEWGMFEDIKFNGVTDFLDHAQAIGEAYGPLYDADVMHEDLIGMRMGGEWRGTPYLRNIMVKGSADEAAIIDLEDAHFTDDGRTKDHSPHLHEMNPRNRDDEYQAIESAILVEGIASLDHFDSVADGQITKQHLLYQNPDSGLDHIDRKKFSETKAANEEVNSLMSEIEAAFQEGWHDGQTTASKFYDNTAETEIPIQHKPEDRVKPAAKTRMSEDIRPAVRNWLDELN